MMDSSVVDVHGAVTSIIQDFSEASELFQKWRKGRAGKKAVAQEECKTSLQEGISTIKQTFNRLSLQHSAKFDRGDRECLDSLLNTKTNFQESVINVQKHAIFGKITKTATADPLGLIQMSVIARKDTVLAIDELSRRILSGTIGPYTSTDPGDALPHMPLRPSGPPRPPRPYGPSENSTQTSVPNTGPKASNTSIPNSQSSQTSFATSLGSVSSSLAWLETPFTPVTQRHNVYMPMSSWTAPKFGTSQTLVRTRPSSSETALSWMKDNIFPIKPTRPYYDITPLKPTPTVIPTFICDEDTSDVLEESRRTTARLWDAANPIENDGLRRQAHSAPILQEPWKDMLGLGEEEECPPNFPLYEREPTPGSLEEEDESQKFLRPATPSIRPSSAQGGRRIRSEPMLDFSMPASRFMRHASGPN